MTKFFYFFLFLYFYLVIKVHLIFLMQKVKVFLIFFPLLPLGCCNILLWLHSHKQGCFQNATLASVNKIGDFYNFFSTFRTPFSFFLLKCFFQHPGPCRHNRHQSNCLVHIRKFENMFYTGRN